MPDFVKKKIELLSSESDEESILNIIYDITYYLTNFKGVPQNVKNIVWRAHQNIYSKIDKFKYPLDIERSLIAMHREAMGTVINSRPNLFLSGFGKCGTTSMHDILTKSPDIAGGLVKEVRYFGHVSNKYTTNPYDSMFPNVKCKYIIDSSCSYISKFDEDLLLMGEYSPSSKHIILTRDPHKRAISAYFSPGRAHLRKQAELGKGAELPTVEESLRREMRLLRKLLPKYSSGEIQYHEMVQSIPTRHIVLCLFNLHIQRLKRLAPTAEVFVFRAEDVLFSGASDGYAEVFRALDVQPVRAEIQRLNKSERQEYDRTLDSDIREFFAEFDEYVGY